MFKKVLPRYVAKTFASGKYPKKLRKDLNSNDIVDKFKTTAVLTKTTPITSIGSCFSQKILAWLNNKKYNVITPQWGITYNPKSVKQILQMGLDPDSWKPQQTYWNYGDYDYRFPYIKQIRGSSPKQLGKNPKQDIKKSLRI